MTRPIKHFVTATILILASASLALGASMTVSSSGNGVFTVQGSNMDGVAAIDLTLSYDTTTLKSPTVSQGGLISGAMLAANPNNPGSIRIAVVRTTPFSGSGTVVTITFGTHAGGGAVTKTSSLLTDSNGKSMGDNPSTSSANDYNIGDSSSGGGGAGGAGGGGAGSNNTANPPTTTTGSPNPTYLGTVTMPSDNPSQNVTKPAPEAGAKPAEAPTAETPQSTATPAVNETATVAKTRKAETATTSSNTAVLERFRAYRGVKTPAILIALFKQQISASFRQEPLVALSDGTTAVTIVADLSAESGSSPNFALNGAKLVSLRKDDASSMWFIEALPTKGALSASLMVLSENHVTEYPLTIAPAIKNVAATEAAFAAFLKDAAKAPAQHDLNGDGNYDGIDDYIYTANYLARQEKAPTAK